MAYDLGHLLPGSTAAMYEMPHRLHTSSLHICTGGDAQADGGVQCSGGAGAPHMLSRAHRHDIWFQIHKRFFIWQYNYKFSRNMHASRQRNSGQRMAARNAAAALRVLLAMRKDGEGCQEWLEPSGACCLETMALMAVPISGKAALLFEMLDSVLRVCFQEWLEPSGACRLESTALMAVPLPGKA